jgi:hypothetical protein
LNVEEEDVIKILCFDLDGSAAICRQRSKTENGVFEYLKYAVEILQSVLNILQLDLVEAHVVYYFVPLASSNL